MSSIIEVDLYQWMPGHGEDRVTTKSENGKFYINVEFEGEGNRIERKILEFDSVSYFSVGSFPGPGCLEKNYQFDFEFTSGCVIRLKDSSFADEWKVYWESSTGTTSRTFNHYLIFFTSENKIIHVIANSVSVQ